MKSVEETHSNKNRVFDLTFSSKQVDKLDMLVNVLPKNFRRKFPYGGYCLMSKERDYSFSVRGYKRANALIALFTSSMPRIKIEIFTAGKNTTSPQRIKT